MRFIFQLAVMVVGAGLSLTAVSADKPKVGTLQGSVNFCGKGGVEGMQVYIPGLPYVVITGTDGRFQFSDVPEGKYELHYRLGDRLLNHNRDVHVLSKQVTDLSVISFCGGQLTAANPHTVPPAAPVSSEAAPAVQVVPQVPAAAAVVPQGPAGCGAGAACEDADGDGVIAAQDCDDHDAKVHPGAIELCDGKDNNCNGQVDENAMVLMMHGIGSCQNGQVAVQSCKEGFSDCDGQASNGCETDIKNDPEHCGGCNESCTPTEVCVAGGCE